MICRRHLIKKEVVRMDLLKDATIATIKRLPDGCSMEDIMRTNKLRYKCSQERA